MIQDNNEVDTIKFFEGVAECLMNDSDTLKDVKIRAKNLAEQNAQQKIVDYIRDFLEFRYLTFPDDEILSIANEIFKISNINYGMKDSGGNEMIIQSAVIAQIDDNDIMNCLVGFFNERTELKSENESISAEIDNLKSQNESLRKENESLSKLRAEIDNFKRQNESLRRENETLSKLSEEINSLKRQNESLRRENENFKRPIVKSTPKVTSGYDVALASRKYNEAYRLFTKSDYKGAIKLYTEAIELNPNYKEAYKQRGNSYLALGQQEKANADFRKAK